MAPCLQALASLRGDVLEHQQAALLPTRPSDAERLRILVGRFKAVSTRLGDLLAQVEPESYRSAIHQGFTGIMRSLLADLDRNLADDLDRVWLEQVHQTFATHLAKRFPFARDATDDAAMVEFESFFNASGPLWTCLTHIETLRDVQVLGRPALVVGDEYQRVLRAAQDIRSLFFARASATLALRFPYRLLQREHVRDLRMQFGARTHTLYERPDARHLAEIVHGDPSGARISAQGVDGRWMHREDLRGDWGFLRLLLAGDPKAIASGDVLCTWEHEATIANQAQTIKACVVLEAGGIGQVVCGGLLSGLTLPRHILSRDAVR